MLHNILKLALRGLLRDRLYAFINIGGLSLGIAASILLLLWSQDELRFDAFHPHATHTYRINANFADNGMATVWNVTPAPIAAFARREVPAVEKAVRISHEGSSILFTYNGKNFIEKNAAYVDPEFFSVFDFGWTHGNAAKPFPDSRSIVLTESMAKKIFGDENAIGKTILRDNKDEFTVSGITKDFPKNSSIRLNVMFPFSILIENFNPGENWKSLESNWGDYYYETYVQLDPSADTQRVAEQLTTIHHKNQQNATHHYSLQPLKNLHLYAADGSDAGMQSVRIFLIVAIAILLIACINYINLATARATRRAKEVGVRKTIGADRLRLVFQFLLESAVVSLLAMLLSFVIIQLLIPFYNDLSGKTLSFNLTDNVVSLTVIGALMVTWLVSGIYPALVLSSFKPIEVIRGKLTISGGNSTFRKILVVTQFSLSIVIIVSMFVVGEQLDFIRNKNLGFTKDNLFYFSLRGDMFRNAQGIKNQLLKDPAIEQVMFANQNIISIDNSTGDTDWDGKPEGQGLMIHPMNIDENFMKTLNMEIVQGKGFTGLPADSAGFILNETAVKEAGISDPIGKRFTLWDKKGIIIGVVKDFNHQSIQKKIEPTIFFSNKNWLWLVYVKVQPNKSSEAVAAVEKIWKQYNPDYPLDYTFLDSTYDRMYKSEQRMSKLFTAFSVIAICISCLGLFGLATFTAIQRMKEIGVRKVMGASVQQIVMLLSKDFLKLVALAFILAAPVSYIMLSQWLQGYAYQTAIPWQVFIITGSLVFLLAFATVSFQTIKAALANPVKSLRSE